MPGLESLRGSRGGTLPGYLSPCCHPCCPSPYHHRQDDMMVSLQCLPRHLDLPHLGKEPGGSNPPQLWKIKMHQFPPLALKAQR